jgi:hypothetical protein
MATANNPPAPAPGDPTLMAAPEPSEEQDQDEGDDLSHGRPKPGVVSEHRVGVRVEGNYLVEKNLSGGPTSRPISPAAARRRRLSGTAGPTNRLLRRGSD